MRKITFFKVCGKDHASIQLDSDENLTDEETDVEKIAPPSKQTNADFYRNVLYYKPLIVAFLILAVGTFYYFYPAEKSFFAFVRIWCLFQAYAVLTNLSEQLRFYDWWSKSTLSDANTRGLGTNGFCLFGVIPMPNLSSDSLRAVSVSYIGCLVLCALFAEQPFIGYLFIIATVLALFYFSSLWAERNASYHREYVTVAILFYFCFTPDFYGFGQSSPAISFLIQLHITSIYVAGAAQKIACSFWAKKNWFACAPHGFMWRAMWSKPYYSTIQRFFFLNPKLMAFGGFLILLLELAFFTLFWASHDTRVTAITCMLVFHIAVFVLQGIDYLTFWSPAFLLWFIVQGSSDTSILNLLHSWYMAPAILFCATQLLYALTFAEDLNVNAPPFTCCPMFVNVCRFNERIPQYYCMWDLSSPIAYERLEWIYPFVKAEFGMGMVESDLEKLPFNFIGFGYYAEPCQLPALQRKWFHTDLIKDEGFFLYANYVVDPKLSKRLAQIMIWLHENQHSTSIYDKIFLKDAMVRYTECYKMFVDDIFDADADGPSKGTDLYLKTYTCEKEEEIRAVYDEWAPSYDDQMCKLGWNAPNQIAELLARAFASHERPSARILDVGAGTGLVGLALAHIGFRSLDAFDISSEMLKQAKARAVYANTILGNAENLTEYIDQKYDAVVCVGALNFGHILPNTLIELIHATKQNGHICFSTREDYYQISAHVVQKELEQQQRWRLIANEIYPTSIKDMPHRHWLYQVIDF